MLNSTITTNNHSLIILTPNDEFKSWLKKAIFNVKAGFPVLVDQVVTQEVLDNHSVSFITPQLYSKEDFETFYNQYHDILFTLLLFAWPFQLEAWPTDKQKNIKELFNFSYYLNFIESDKIITTNSNNSDLEPSTVVALKPNAPLKEWIHDLTIKNLITTDDSISPPLDDIDLDILRRCGTAFTIPEFQKEAEQLAYVKEHFQELFEQGLKAFCKDESAWPKDRNYETFVKWFDFLICSSVVDVVKFSELHKAA